jgi:glycosyltransferase involved in cell wall biosynthesis
MAEKVSVVITTYSGDNVTELSESIDSILNQTHLPAEIVLIEDGPLSSDLKSVVKNYQDRYHDLFSITSLETNRGTGYARRIGVENATHEFVAMMDADDISISERIDIQAQYLHRHPEVDAVGGYIAEFTTDMDSPHSVRRVPLDPETIASKARFRSPMNQTTVMARRTALLEADNYRDVARMEDYGLWVRMLTNGSTLANIPKVFVKVRGGDAMYTRRGGWEYLREEIRLQREFLTLGFVSPLIAVMNLCIRIPTRLMPNRIRGILYSQFLRKST